MATYQEQREREYQNKLVKRFQDELGYKYLGNWQYAKGETVNSLSKQNSPILDDEVCNFLKDQKKKDGKTPRYTERQIEDVLYQLKSKARLGNTKMSGLMQCNTDLYNILMSGIKSQPDPDSNHTIYNLSRQTLMTTPTIILP